MSVNAVVVRALEKASAKPWDEAAPILHAAMDNIMEGELEPDDDDEEEGEFDMSQMMQGMQQMMQQGMQQAAQAMQQGGGMMEYVQKVQELQQQLAGRTGEYGRLYVESTTVSRHLYGKRSATIMKFNDYGTEYF